MQTRLAPAALAAALLLCMPALARQASPSDDDAAAGSLPAVKVKASAMQTTTGMELSVRQTPQSVTVVSKPVLREQGITDMAGAMRSTTGINVLSETGRVRFQSRGFYIDQIQEDGISSTVPGSSGNPTRDPQSMTDLAVYEHIEVLRGPTGLTQANGEPGGTINAVRKKPTSQRQASVELQGNRWGQARAVVDASGSLNADKTLRGRFVGVADRIDSFVDRVDGSKATLYGVMDWQLGGATVLTAGALYQRISDTPDYYGVAMGPQRSASPLPRGAFMGFDWNRDVFKKANVFMDVEHYFSATGSLRPSSTTSKTTPTPATATSTTAPTATAASRAAACWRPTGKTTLSMQASKSAFRPTSTAATGCWAASTSCLRATPIPTKAPSLTAASSSPQASSTPSHSTARACPNPTGIRAPVTG